MPTLEDSGPRRNRFTRTQVGALPPVPRSPP